MPRFISYIKKYKYRVIFHKGEDSLFLSNNLMIIKLEIEDLSLNLFQ